MENYNKHLKEKLGTKKIVNYINFLSFIKGEVERFFRDFSIKNRNYEEILNFNKGNCYGNYENKRETGINILSSYDIEMKVQISKNIIKSAHWLKWINNSCS